MLRFPGFSAYAWRQSNYPANGSGTAAAGHTVTSGAGAYGSWAEVITAANMSQDAYWIGIHPINMFTNAQARQAAVEIGVDPAGGTSYTTVIGPLFMAKAGSDSGYCGAGYMFPLLIRAGSSIAVRAYGTTAFTFSPRVLLLGQPSHPENVPVGARVRNIGTASLPAGQAITPGNSGAWSSWVDLGATADPLWWWQLSVSNNSTSVTTLMYYFELAVGDATNKVLVSRSHVGVDSSERMADISASNININGFLPVKSGTNVYVRATSSGTSSAGFSVMAHAAGG